MSTVTYSQAFVDSEGRPVGKRDGRFIERLWIDVDSEEEAHAVAARLRELGDYIEEGLKNPDIRDAFATKKKV